MSRIIEAFAQFFDGAGNPLVDGKIQFYKSGTTTDKTTFRDSAQTIANDNPYILDGNGRTPFAIFGTGVYKAILFDSDDQQIKVEDPVGGSITGAQWDEWEPGLIYDVGFIVTGSDGKNYRSIINGNRGFDPISNSSEWEELQLGRIWNVNVTYSDKDSVYASDGNLYTSNNSGNLGNDPVLGLTDDWTQVTSGLDSAEQLNYSADVAAPDSNVISLNPSKSGLVVTLATSAVGDIKRLINISAFDAIIKLSGDGFLVLPAGETSFTFRVGSDWYAVNDANEDIPARLILLNTADVFNNSAATTRISTVKITDTKIAIAYADGTTSGRVILGTVADGIISFGTEVEFNAANTDYVSLARLTDDKLAIAYQDKGNSNQGTIIVGDITGTVVAFGSEALFNAAATTFVALVRVTDSKMAIAYSTASTGTLIVGDVTGTTVAFGSAAGFRTTSPTAITMSLVADDKIAVSYHQAVEGKCKIATISGTVPTFGVEVVFHAAETLFPVITQAADNKALVAYQATGTAGAGACIVGTISGTVIAFGTPVDITVASSGFSFTSADMLADDKVVISWYQTLGGNVGRVIVADISGTTISLGDAESFNSNTSEWTSVAGIVNGFFVIGYNDGGNSNFGTSVVGREFIL